MRLSSLAPLLGWTLVVVSCAEPPPPTAPSRTTSDVATSHAKEYPAEEGAWGPVHSQRFNLTLRLPDAKAWKVDDQSRPALSAVHEATSTNLWVTITREDELMNRQKCEAKAQALGWIPKAPLTTIEEQVVIGPDAYDSRVWVALDAARKGGGIEGHVYLFGGFLRKCLLVHLSTRVETSADEEVLSSRLAVARARIFKRIALDPPRTTDDAVVPREPREIKK